MRLINTATLKLEEFPNHKAVPFAILSHVWGPEEVTFHDFQKPHAHRMAGYEKITGCCAQALSDGFDYVWIDTCCIDKSSSAELSEAINSMYLWYSDAALCYAYLVDVSTNGTQSQLKESFAESKWFTRGWTLQELLAPYAVTFFSQQWVELGTRNSMSDLISSITRIPADILSGTGSEDISIAMKMSWAADRTTSRVEDGAYCLLGIFGVHMPTLYGEGEAAFMRLQQEIIRVSSDHSIFAWQRRGLLTSGILAPSAGAFRQSGDIESYPYTDISAPHGMTNLGLQISLPIREEKIRRKDRLGSQDESIFVATLNARVRTGRFGPLEIKLKKLRESQFERIDAHSIAVSNETTRYEDYIQSIYVRQGPVAAYDFSNELPSWAWIPKYLHDDLGLLEANPPIKAVEIARRSLMTNSSHDQQVLIFSCKGSVARYRISFGVDRKYQPWLQTTMEMPTSSALEVWTTDSGRDHHGVKIRAPFQGKQTLMLPDWRQMTIALYRGFHSGHFALLLSITIQAAAFPSEIPLSNTEKARLCPFDVDIDMPPKYKIIDALPRHLCLSNRVGNIKIGTVPVHDYLFPDVRFSFHTRNDVGKFRIQRVRAARGVSFAADTITSEDALSSSVEHFTLSVILNDDFVWIEVSGASLEAARVRRDAFGEILEKTLHFSLISRFDSHSELAGGLKPEGIVKDTTEQALTSKLHITVRRLKKISEPQFKVTIHDTPMREPTSRRARYREAITHESDDLDQHATSSLRFQ